MKKDEGKLDSLGTATIVDIAGKRKVFDSASSEKNQERAEGWLTQQGYQKVHRGAWVKGSK